MRKSKSEFSFINLHYSFIHFFYWMCLVSCQSYAAFYLLDSGMTNTQIGLLLGIGGFLAALIQPFIASWADKPKSPSVRVITIVMSVLAVTGSLLLFVFRHRSFAGTYIVYLLSYLIIMMEQSSVNALGTESINNGKKISYGFGRGVGSLGYMIASFIVGHATASAGAVSIPAALMITSAATAVVTFFFPFVKRQQAAAGEDKSSAGTGSAAGEDQSSSGTGSAAGEDQSSSGAGSAAGEDQSPAGAGSAAGNGKSAGSLLTFFVRYPQITVAMLSLVLIFIGHTYINNFLLPIVETKGGDSADMGNLMSFAAFPELVIMLCYGWLRRLMPDRFWFRISGIFFTLKVLCTMLAPSIGLMYPVQLFQPFGWGILAVSTVYYINDIVDDDDKIKGQAIFTATFTLGTVLGSLSSGVLLDHGGVTAMLTVGTVTSAIGAGLLLSSAKIKEHR